MSLIVKKYGGSSIETIDLITELAHKLAIDKRSGDDLVVVVSAMAKTTDYLFSLAHQISDTPYQRELDMLVTAGERISMALLSIALHKEGVPAISFTGSQSGIITNDSHGNAKIINVNAFRIRDELNKGKVVIVAGYQGVSLNKEITTLGRGGSDTTAVALAGFLNADRCQINKDVDGIYSADPKIVHNAIKYDTIDYKLMLFLSCCGCKAIHPRAVEFAMNHNVPIEIKSTFNNNSGTLIRNLEVNTTIEANMQETPIIAISSREQLLIYNFKTDNMSSAVTNLKRAKINYPDFEIISEEELRFAAKETDKQQVHQAISEDISSNLSVIDGICSISFAFCDCNDDLHLLANVLLFFEQKGIRVVWLTKNPLGFTAYLKSETTGVLVNELHHRFVDNCK